ncbi:MAG: hypothetical protein H7Y31_15805 [Chitinophagaceae bacterium]|nr:hypothetical protein [Chitinophagaceae bacterium]
MELDNLKDIWKQQSLEQPLESAEQIRSLLHKKSQSPVSKMKRNLRRELNVVLILYSASIIFYAFYEGGQYWEISVMMLIVGVFFGAYYYKKNKLLTEMENVSGKVKYNLETKVIELRKYIRFYYLAGIFLPILIYPLTGLIMFYKSPLKELNSFFGWFFIGFGVFFGFVVYFVNKWYVHKLYGKHLKKLEDLLIEMNEVADNNTKMSS